ncbi:MAG: SDR family oxidoreductase [Luteolibacter sp.]
MPDFSYFSCALVTGASAGLGEEFALQIAPRVGKLVLVARRADRLKELASRIREEHPNVAVAVYPADLSDHRERLILVEALVLSGFIPDLLVNNAGLGDYGEFATSPWEKTEAMLRINVEALTHLTHALLPHMIHRREGAILNISSLASLLPIPDFAVYAATKAYVTSFSEALRIELRDYSISVLAVCPGPVKTEFGTVARREEATGDSLRQWFYVPKEQVVAEALHALDRDKARVYPGLKTAVAAAVIAALPLVALRLILGTRPRRE